MAIVKHLIADEFGTHISKYSERLRIVRIKTGERLAEAPLFKLETVLVQDRGISVSSDAVKSCANRGIPIHFIDKRGNVSASLYSAGLTGTIKTRRAQLSSFDSHIGLQLAKSFVLGKIRNQANLLKYMVKNRKNNADQLYNEIHQMISDILDHEHEVENMTAENIDQIRFKLLSAEGRAAQYYWKAIAKLLLMKIDWPGRKTQGAMDPLNSALNYGYGILYSQIERCLVLAGLDPYGGFLHVDRPGKPSLALDYIEEFRQTVVDKTLFGLINKGVFIHTNDQGYLEEKTRKILIEKIYNRLDCYERYEGKKVALRNIMQIQARHIATFLRKERNDYQPFVAGW